jgi:peptidoglycan/LPS O-acetylase OafA/YrhL
VVTPTNSRSRIQGLDLLRGVAILLVLLRHSWPDAVGLAGTVGVVMFFTLSGYLITGVLVSDIEKFGHIRYGHFYRNRAIRLLPALAFMLVGFTVIEGIFGVSGTGTRDIAIGVLVSLLYVMNLPGIPHGSDNLSHLWTLANEEQFYLVWPVLLRWGITAKKIWSVVIVAAVLVMIGLILTIWIAAPEIVKVYTFPTAWTIAMIIGAAARIGRTRLTKVLHGRRLSLLAVLAGTGLLAISMLPEAKESPLTYVLGGPAIGVLSVVVIWKLREMSAVPLAVRPLVWMGTISYAAYLWNYPISWWLRDAGMHGWQVWTVALTLGAAGVSWFLVERPANLIKKRLDRDRDSTAKPASPDVAR